MFILHITTFKHIIFNIQNNTKGQKWLMSSASANLL